LACAGTARISFYRHFRYSDEGLLQCIVDVTSGEQGSGVKGENGFTSVQKSGLLVAPRVAETATRWFPSAPRGRPDIRVRIQVKRAMCAGLRPAGTGAVCTTAIKLIKRASFTTLCHLQHLQKHRDPQPRSKQAPAAFLPR